MITRPKHYLDINVHEAAIDRFKYLYEQFDEVVVSFSGGKDSTAALNVAIEVATELNRLPVKVVFFDEEAIHPPTIEYVHRVAKMPEVDMYWYCLEFKHRNACSNEEPFWYCWDKDKVSKWVRPMPNNVIKEHPRFHKGMSFQEFSEVMFSSSDGMVCQATGVRTQESFRRMKAMSTKKNDNYIKRDGNSILAHPIYDWSSEDVWLGVYKFKWDYNKTYDVFNQTSMYNKFLGQRVCPPFGEEPLRSLWIYAECFPEMWHKMIDRVKGVESAWRYANSDIYGYGKIAKPDDITWPNWIKVIFNSYDQTAVKIVKKNVNSLISRHFDKTDNPIPNIDPHPLTGTSWSFIAKIAIKGDFKDRTAPKLENNAIKARKDLGIPTYKHAISLYGSAKFKAKKL